MRSKDDAQAETATSVPETLDVEAFDPDDVRPWRFHNRRRSGMDDASLRNLSESIKRDGQQQLGLARRLPAGDTHLVEVIFGVRRLEACRRAGVRWRAEVRDESFTDVECAALMHGENEWTQGVSPLENAVQWRSMLKAGVFPSQSALAVRMGYTRATVSRAVLTASVLLGESWIDRLVRPVMHEFTGRAADRLAIALADDDKRETARTRAASLVPGTVSAKELHTALLGAEERSPGPETVFVRRKGRAGRGAVTAKIERGGDGGWSVRVRPHEQSPAEVAELAEQVEAVLAEASASASDVRLGRRLVSLLTAEDARASDQSWLEGCVWAAARASGLDWDRWHCMAVAELLRSQRGGWEHSVLKAVTRPFDGHQAARGTSQVELD